MLEHSHCSDNDEFICYRVIDFPRAIVQSKSDEVLIFFIPFSLE
jgi:hypothetical protein